MICRKCGACCTGPDISTLAKPAGLPCRHLNERCECSIYDERPRVCRGYMPDEICDLIAAPTLEERARKYRELFDL